jgi:hypothetical protein
LFVRFGSLEVELTVAVFEDKVDELKLCAATLIVMITNAPSFILFRLQLTVVVEDVYEQLPCEAGTDTELKVTCDGSTSVTVTPVATAGPLFVTCKVYVRFVPWFTGSGDAVFRIATSDCDGEVTYDVVEAVLLALFGSVERTLEEDTVALFVIAVPGAVPAVTFNTSVKVETVPEASDAFVHVCVPPEGAGQLQPAGEVGCIVIETTEVLAGSVSVIVTLSEAPGPLFVTVTV